MSGTNILQSYDPTRQIGPNFGGMVASSQQLLQLRQQQEQIKQQNALMGVFQDPKSLDATGQPTADTLQKVTAINPQFGLQLRQSSMVAQDQQIRRQYLMSEMAASNADRIAESLAPVVERREEKIKGGMPPAQADQEAQNEYKAALDQLGKSGFNPDLLKQAPPGWDPVKVPMLVQNTKGFRDWQNQQRADQRLKDQEKAEADRGAIQEQLPDGTAVIYHPNAPRGKEYTFAATGEAVPPDKLKGLSKVGTTRQEPKPQPVTVDGKGQDAIWKDGKWFQVDGTTPITGEVRLAGKPAASGSQGAERSERFEEMKAAQQKAGIYTDDTSVYRSLDKQMAEDRQTAISDDAALIAAQVALKTGHPPAWMGRSQASLTKFLDTYAAEAKRQGLNADDIAANIAKFSGEMAEARTLGTSSARIDFAAKELDVALPQAMETSERVWRPGFKKLAEVQQAIKGQTSDPDLLEFAQFNQQVMSAYSAMMNRGGVSTVHAMERAEGLLSTATSQAGYMRQLDTLHKEVQIILYGTQAAKDHLRAEITGSPEVTTPPVLTGVPRPGAAGQTPWKTGAPIPAGAIADLKAKPETAAHFDDVFGKGEAAKVLGTPAQETQPAKQTAPLPLTAGMKETDLQDGQLYQTAKGVAKWDSKQKKFFPVGGP